MNFISNQNADLLFEVINSSKFMIDREKHNNEMNQFSFNKKFMNLNKQELLTMNKEYISYISQLYNSKINNTPITFEELQSLKREKFNIELNKKQEEFQELFQKKLPKTLNFKEEIDKPISEMEDLISQTIAQRSFDIEQLLPPLPVENSTHIQKKQITWDDERGDERHDWFSLKNSISSIETKLDIIIKILTSNA
jgi:hypothetical protein